MISPILLTSCVVLLVLGMLAYFSRNADFIIWGGVILLLVTPVAGPDGDRVIGVIGPAEALAGLANEGVVTIAAMFIVAAGLRETGALRLLLTRALSALRQLRTRHAPECTNQQLLEALQRSQPTSLPRSVDAVDVERMLCYFQVWQRHR